MSKEILISRGYVVVVDDDDYDAVADRSWYAHRSNTSVYARAKIHGRNTPMHRWLLRAVAGKLVDHVNGNTLDNRRVNLRLCSHSENAQNRICAPKSESGYRGVFRNTKNRLKPWRSQIIAFGKRYSLGVFAGAVEAAIAYDNAARDLHGEFASVNILDVVRVPGGDSHHSPTRSDSHGSYAPIPGAAAVAVALPGGDSC